MKPISVEEIINKAANRAAIVAIKEYERQKQLEDQKKLDRRLHNTKLLLKNYRNFKSHCIQIKNELVELESPDREIIAFMDSDEFALESVKRSKRRTLAMVQFIDRTLEVYELLCQKDTEKDSIRYYNTIKKLYIDEPKMTFEKVAECHNVHPRTVRRDVEEAVKALTVLIFGVDGIRFKNQ